MEFLIVGGIIVLLMAMANKNTPAPVSQPSPVQGGSSPVQAWPTYQTPALPGIPPQTVSQSLGAPVVETTMQAIIQQSPNPSPIPSNVPVPTLGNSGGWMTVSPDVVPGRIMPPLVPPVVDTPTATGAGTMRGTLIAPVQDLEQLPPVSSGSITPPIIATSPTAANLDSIGAKTAAVGGSGDRMIMQLQTGAQIWQTPGGNTYQVWPE
jgi:hypothetical protein